MQRLASLQLRTLLFAVVFVCGISRASAQIRIVSPQNETIGSTSTSSLDDLIKRGLRFEEERRWGDALTLYEDALRNRPGDPSIGPRHELAKIHYDLGRRLSLIHISEPTRPY